ncbi:MAG: endonuclease/exonuclease/phosphatase family protein [Chloroflexota bacterium]
MNAVAKQQAWAEFRNSLMLMGALGRSWLTLVQLTWRWVVWNGLTAVSLLLFTTTLTGFIPVLAPTSRWLRRLNWLAELSSHFQPHYFWILVSISVLFFLRQRFRQGAITAVFALINLSLIAPLYLPVQASSAPPSQTYRAVSFNVYTKNPNYNETLAFLAETDPDIVVLAEILEAWEPALLPLLEKYPYNNHVDSHDYHGTIIYSRFPFANANEVERIADDRRSAALTMLDMDGQLLTLMAAHTRSPVRVGRMEQRNNQIRDLRAALQRKAGPTMLMGDLNTTPWSPIFREFLAGSRLENGRYGFGLQASWPAPLGPLGIPIDHILISPEITIHEFERGPDLGSDHYPIIVDFSFTPDG